MLPLKKKQYILFLSYMILIIFGGIYYIWGLKLTMDLSFYVVILIVNFIIIIVVTKYKYDSYLLYRIKDFNKYDFSYLFVLLLMSSLSIHSLFTWLSLTYNQFLSNNTTLTNIYSSDSVVFSFYIGCSLIMFNERFFNINSQKSNYNMLGLYNSIFVIIILSLALNRDLIIYIVPYVIFISLPVNFGTDINRLLNFKVPPNEVNIALLITAFYYFFMKLQILFPDYFISIITSNEITNFLLQFINGW